MDFAFGGNIVHPSKKTSSGQGKKLLCGLVMSILALAASSEGFASSAESMQFRGFLNAGVGVSDAIEKTADGIFSQPTYTQLSRVGFVASKQINAQWDAAMQVVARGELQDEFTAKFEWGLLTYRPTSDLAIRVGKQKYPFWLISDQIDVGVLYPWVRPPVEVYDIMPITSYVGASAEYDFKSLLPLTDNVTLEVFGGGTREKVVNTSSQVVIDNVTGYGSVLTVRRGISVIRGIYAKAHIRDAYAIVSTTLGASAGALQGATVDYRPRINFGHVEIWSLGTGLNLDNWLFWYEFASRHTEDLYYRLRQGEYATIGYYLFDRKLLPHATFSRTVTNKASGSLGGIQAADTGMQTSGRFGLNYAFSDEMILKTEYERTWVHGGADIFSARPRGPIQVYSAALTAVF